VPVNSGSAVRVTAVGSGVGVAVGSTFSSSPLPSGVPV